MWWCCPYQNSTTPDRPMLRRFHDPDCLPWRTLSQSHSSSFHLSDDDSVNRRIVDRLRRLASCWDSCECQMYGWSWIWDGKMHYWLLKCATISALCKKLAFSTFDISTQWDHQAQPRRMRRLWKELCWINTYKLARCTTIEYTLKCILSIFFSLFFHNSILKRQLTNEQENKVIRRLWRQSNKMFQQIIHDFSLPC